MHFDYLTLLACGSNLPKEEYDKSKKIRDGFKAGSPHVIQLLINFIKESELVEYFSNACLIPAPKSSKDILGGLKPSKQICESLVKNGIGSSVNDIITRHTAIRKSSNFTTADERPSVKEHQETLRVENLIIEEENLILIDDVLTLGRISFACCDLLQNAYPNKTIRIFCPVKTSRFDNVSKLESIRKGIVSFNSSTGKTTVY